MEFDNAYIHLIVDEWIQTISHKDEMHPRALPCVRIGILWMISNST
jgi:hypothetical protein